MTSNRYILRERERAFYF